MKRLIAMLLVLLMISGLCGCDSGRGNSEKNHKAASTGSDLSWEEIEKIAEEELAKEAEAAQQKG